jgi:hypothetical protein
MIEYEIEDVEKCVPKRVTCDVCKKIFDYEKDIMEVQEFTLIDFIAGYGSIFGDMSRVKCEICQDCLKEKLGEFLRIEEI